MHQESVTRRSQGWRFATAQTDGLRGGKYTASFGLVPRRRRWNCQSVAIGQSRGDTVLVFGARLNNGTTDLQCSRRETAISISFAILRARQRVGYQFPPFRSSHGSRIRPNMLDKYLGVGFFKYSTPREQMAKRADNAHSL